MFNAEIIQRIRRVEVKETGGDMVHEFEKEIQYSYWLL